MMHRVYDVLYLGDLRKHTPRIGRSFLFLLFMAFFLFADQNLIAPNLKNIANSIGIQDEKEIDVYIGGVVPALFFILGGIVSLSIGYFSEKYPRKLLLIITVLLGEIPCFLTGLANSFPEFLIYRTLCGFGLGGVFPLIFSIIGDLFSTQSRVVATAYISLAMGLGVSIGQLLGGILGDINPVDGWRWSFMILSAPSFLIVGLYALFCDEPKRGVFDTKGELSESHRLTWRDVKELIRTRTNVFVFLQGIPGCVPWGVFFVFLVDYYEQAYLLSKTEASGLLTFAAIGIMIGTVLGGVIGQTLYNKNHSYLPLFGMSAILLGIIPCLVLLYAKDFSKSIWFIPFNLLTGVIIALPVSNIRTILINVNPPWRRSAAFAFYNLTDDLGKGLGPAMSAALLYFIPDRTAAFTVSILFWLPCGLLWLPTLFTFKKDESQAITSLS